MPKGHARFLAFTTALSILGCLGVGLGCATPVSYTGLYDYFAVPGTGDAWSPKIAGWQRRERSEENLLLRGVPSVSAPGDSSAQNDSRESERADRSDATGESPDTSAEQAAEAVGDAALREKYFGFRADRRRAMAREFAAWIQAEAKRHYVADGSIDHWATLEDTLRSDGDDCDGLELLVFHALRDLGFSEQEIYRAIVYRPEDGQHHMVTLWFEDQYDPWVIDPTGAMVRGMHRMSDVPGWVPLKVFSDTDEFTVRQRPIRGARLAAHP